MRKIILPFLLLTLMACNNAKQEGDHDHDHDHPHDHETTATTADSHQHEGTSATVSLDNGKKWKANIETTEGIAKMKEITQKGVAENKAPADLLAGLQQEFKTIFDKCTMTGEAHNQLHNFLLPVKAQLDSLKSESATVKNLEELQHYLDTYPQYFE